MYTSPIQRAVGVRIRDIAENVYRATQVSDVLLLLQTIESLKADYRRAYDSEVRSENALETANEKIAQREAKVAQLAAVIEKREATISCREDVIDCRDSTIDELEQKVVALEEQLSVKVDDRAGSDALRCVVYAYTSEDLSCVPAKVWGPFDGSDQAIQFIVDCQIAERADGHTVGSYGWQYMTPPL